MYNDMMGMGEKPRKNIYTRKTRKNSPFVFRVERNRKQAGPTLGGAGILIYRDKRNKGYGSIEVGNMIFYI